MKILDHLFMRSVLRSTAVKWAITVNNYTEEQLQQIKDWAQTNCQYAVIGKEVAPTTGTHHLQIFIHLLKKLHGSSIVGLQFFRGAHLEVARGTDVQNHQYCSKEGDWWACGELDRKKKKWKTMIDDYVNMPIKEFVDVHPKEALIHQRSLEFLKSQLIDADKTWDGELRTKNIWIWGEPGTGKSRWARSQMDPKLIYLKGANKWWNGYRQGEHKMVLFEDFPQDGKYLAQYMKIWADRYSFTAELKGSSTLVCPGTYFLIVTSNFSIDQVFMGEDAEALKRRFHQVQIRGANDIWLSTNLDKQIII